MIADHFGILQNPKIIALFLSVEQIYTRAGFTEYQHGGQHRIGQKRSYRFVASNRPCHYISPLCLVTGRSKKRRNTQLMVFNRVSWKNVTYRISQKRLWLLLLIVRRNQFMTIILLFMSPNSWLQSEWIKAVWLILILVIFNWDHLPQILISLCFDVSLFLLISWNGATNQQGTLSPTRQL